MKRIRLSKGKFAIVDDSDYALLSQYPWCYNGGYAIRSVWKDGKSQHIPMHAMLVEYPKTMHVDHKNRDTLDNRRENLVICTPQQNKMNQPKIKNTKTQFKGVKKSSRGFTWEASIGSRPGNTGHRKRYIGCFKDAHTASIAYDLWATFIYENAYTNNKIVLKGP